MTTPFLVAHSQQTHWGLAVKEALERLGPLPASGFGLAYVAGPLADDQGSVATFLREATPVKHWATARCDSICSGAMAEDEETSLALMAGHAPKDAVRFMEDADSPDVFLHRYENWLLEQNSVALLMHAPLNAPNLLQKLRFMDGLGPFFTFGALCEEDAEQCDPDGLFFGDGAEILIGHAQSCAQIAPGHLVSSVQGGIVMGLDGQPAAKILKDDAGALIGGDLRRAADFIHAAIPDPLSDDSQSFQVRALEAVDPVRGWMALRGEVQKGDPLFFVRRDEEKAKANFKAMALRLKERLDGRRIRGGLLCASAWASDVPDAAKDALFDCLGEFPLIHVEARGEIFRNQIHEQSGVLALFL